VRKIACLATVAWLAVTFTSAANATPQECIGSYDFAALRCYRDFHGNYKVKNFDIYYGYDSQVSGLENGYPTKGEPCLGALDYLQNSEWFWILASTGNALTDTYLLRRCSVDGV
jgi:hypothetical protein